MANNAPCERTDFPRIAVKDIKPSLPDSDETGKPPEAPEKNKPVLIPVGQPKDDGKVVAELAAMSPLEYGQIRKEQAKALGIQVTVLDDLVKAVRNEIVAANRLPFREVEPWPEPINPATLLDDIANLIRRHIIMDPEQADAATLWAAHTYLTDETEVSPILNINAPERECAKTLLQTLLSRIVHRPLPASNASLSALFRAIETWQPTLLIDEADTFFRDNPELHGMVNAGYKRGGFVLRSEPVGDNFEPRMFSVYCAKSIAGIALEKHLPDSTMSRCIVLNLRRKLPHEKVQRMRHADPKLFDQIASKLARFAEDYSRQVRLASPRMPDELSDRAQDNWESLLAIASCAGDDWLIRATESALKLSIVGEHSASSGNELLADIRDVIKNRRSIRISTADLIQALVEDIDKGWSVYNRGRPLSARQLAKQLAIYGIRPKTVRLGAHETPKGYELSEFIDAFTRYLPPSEDLSPQGNEAGNAKAGMAEDVAADSDAADTVKADVPDLIL